MKRVIFPAAFWLIAACSPSGEEPPSAELGDERVASPHSIFFANLKALCGKAFEGHVVTTDPADEAMASKHLVMHVRDCAEREVRIPFHVGDNRSRTWVVTRTDDGVRLKHDHRHEDGSEDPVTQYGGDSAAATAERMEFPADQHSIDLFTRENLPASVANVWAMEVKPGVLFAYELRRPERHLRIEFDLSREIETPPAPWGAM
jgi:hypothetical protein